MFLKFPSGQRNESHKANPHSYYFECRLPIQRPFRQQREPRPAFRGGHRKGATETLAVNHQLSWRSPALYWPEVSGLRRFPLITLFPLVNASDLKSISPVLIIGVAWAGFLGADLAAFFTKPVAPSTPSSPISYESK